MRKLSPRVIALSIAFLPVSGFLSTGAVLAHILLGQAWVEAPSHTTCSAAVSHKILNDVPMGLYEKKKVVCINVLAPSSETEGEIKDALITVETTAKPEDIEKFYLDWFSKKGWTVSPDNASKALNPQKFPYKFFEAIDKESHNKWILAIGQNQESAAREYQFQFRKSSELETVKNSKTLDDAAVGDGGEQTYTFACYKKLLGDGETRWDDFVSLTKDGTPAGRVYGAVLLYKTNKAKAQPIIETLLTDNDNFESYCGCIISTKTVKEKVAELLKSGDIFSMD